MAHRPNRPRYVLQDNALRLIADTDPAFRKTDGDVHVAAIGIAAGLDSTTLVHLRKGRIGLSSDVMAALATLYIKKAGIERPAAEGALFDLLAGKRAMAVAA